MYRANMGQWLYDLLAWLILGLIIGPVLLKSAKQHEKDAGNRDLANAMMNTMLVTSAEMFNSSCDDFNWMKSVFGRGINWTPFSFETMSRTVNSFAKVLGGDMDTYDFLVNSSGATRSAKPLFDYVKIESVGRGIGQKE